MKTIKDFILRKKAFTPLKNTEYSSFEQNIPSKSRSRKNHKTTVKSRKRERSVTKKDDIASKRPFMDTGNSSYVRSRSRGKEKYKTSIKSRKRRRSVAEKHDTVTLSKSQPMDVNITNNEHSEFLSGLQIEFRQDLSDKLHIACQANQSKNHFPHTLIGLMYRLDLTMLCLLRKFTFKHKYRSLLLEFGDSENDKFNNIVLHYKKKSIHVQIEVVDKYYLGNDASYDRLFTKGKESFYINNYFDSFVKHLIYKSDGLLNNIEYLIIYTNSCLDLTEENKLKEGRSRNFFPFRFDRINIEDCDILKDLLLSNDNTKSHGFYQFSQDETTREELFKRLECSSAVQKLVKQRLSQILEKELKEIFLDKLVFAVNQPNREELNSIVKKEIEKNEVQYDYIALQKKIWDLGDSETENYNKLKRLVNFTPGIIYEFSLLMLFLHDMYLRKNIFSINSERKRHDISNDITVHYKNIITYIKAYNINSKIGYSQLFPSRQQEGKSMLSINRYFTLFFKLKKNVKYFIIYTNGDLLLTEENRLRKGEQSKAFYPLKFHKIDISKKKYKFLMDCSCINKNGLYRFAQEEATRKKLLGLLKLPRSLQKEGRLFKENDKLKFLNKLIFVVNQPNNKQLNSYIKTEVERNYNFNKVPYNYEELHEIALRWSEAYEFGPITERIMKKIFEDIKHNRISYQKIQSKSIDEEMKFVKSVIGSEGTYAFYQFLDFLIKGEGIKYLDNLKRKGINSASVSSILHGAGVRAPKAFYDLYSLWFDGDGNKTHYLETLEEEGVNLANMSSMLRGAGAKASEAFKDLYYLWFDIEINKPQYLKILEEKGIKLATVSSILCGVGANAAKAFTDLYELWFDVEGNKTHYLKTLEKERINLTNMSSILNRAGENAAKAFKELYDLLFDVEGNKTQYLKVLEGERMKLTNMSSILNGAGTNAAKGFKELYDLWFDIEGNKTEYLRTLQEEGIHVTNMTHILHGAQANAAKAFKGLYNFWFDIEGNKTHYLKTLEEEEGINLANVSSVLHGVGANAPKAFKELYNIFFDEQGHKTKYLETLRENGINVTNISSILKGAGSKAPKAFKDLYNLWFDVEGNKTHYLKTLEKKEINLTNMSSILHGAGAKSAKAFKDLYDLWVDVEGNKTNCLKTLEEGINLASMSCILNGVGANAAKAFKNLYDLWFDSDGNKTHYLKTLEEEGINLDNMSSILKGAGAKASKLFRELCDSGFDVQRNKTIFQNTGKRRYK